MSEEIRVSSPRLRVVMEDASTWEVQTYNPDLISWDRTRAKHGWPTMDKAPFLWMTFLAWAASRREGRVPRETTWEVFEKTCLEVGTVTTDDDAGAEESAVGLPTPPGPGPG